MEHGVNTILHFVSSILKDFLRFKLFCQGLWKQLVKFLLILKYLNWLNLTVFWNIIFLQRMEWNGVSLSEYSPMFRTITVPSSWGSSSLMCVIWARLMRVPDSSCIAGGIAVLRNVGNRCLNDAASRHRRLAPSATWAVRNWSLLIFLCNCDGVGTWSCFISGHFFSCLTLTVSLTVYTTYGVNYLLYPTQLSVVAVIACCHYADISFITDLRAYVRKKGLSMMCDA
jgi:hypothetical protein